jgi:isochorismate hydrolase
MRELRLTTKGFFMKRLKSLLIPSGFLCTLPAIADVPPSFTPANSAILLVDHQNLTVSWVKSVPRDTLISTIRELARLGAELHIPLVVTTTMETTQVGPTIKDIQDLAPDAYGD